MSNSPSDIKVVLLVILFVVQLAQGNIFQWTHENQDFPLKDQGTESALLGDPISGHAFPTQCEVNCLWNPLCNAYQHNSKDKLCQLLSASTTDLDFQDKQDWSVYSLGTYTLDEAGRTPCLSRPCSEHGQCIEWSEPSGTLNYKCVCNTGWRGDTCRQADAVYRWKSWEDWSSCSSTCGPAHQKRQRDCVGEDDPVTVVSDKRCDGSPVEYRDCPVLPCPDWDLWSDWSPCSTDESCGRGRKSKTRTCLHGGTPGVDRMCMGPVTQSAPCYNPSCDVPSVLEGATGASGVLKIYNDLVSRWVTVCYDGFNKQAADIACMSSGHWHGAHAVSSSPIDGDVEWALPDIRCSGNERNLARCRHGGWTTQCEQNLAAHVECIVNGGWGTWTAWSECSVTCAAGERVRTRSCDYPAPVHGGDQCSGDDRQSMECFDGPCPVDGAWLPWSPWTDCNATCGGGWRSRDRGCTVPQHSGNNCSGDWVQKEECNSHQCAVDAYWDNWEDWPECSKSCGGGSQTRTRQCVEAKFEGAPCPGYPDAGTETRPCAEDPCPINGSWSPWTTWSECSVTCGGGSQLRTRLCDNPAPQFGGESCAGNSSDTQICNPDFCPVDGNFSEWTSWTICNVTCGGGWSVRFRSCDNPAPQFGGKNCSEPFDERKQCNQHECPIDGVWNSWSDWTECSATCDNGTKSRQRSCDGPYHGGANCTGNDTEISSCFKTPCPVHGSWGAWGLWHACSSTCGTGSQERRRHCDSPAPQHDGKRCGIDFDLDIQLETRECKDMECPVDGQWSLWSDWGLCSHTCGDGTRHRSRLCDNPAPLHGGKPCQPEGETNDTEPCNLGSCAVDGGWGSWSGWGACSTTCGPGERIKTRECDSPVPQFGGLDCSGDGDAREDCEEEKCPVDGRWSEWTDWGECSVECGGGTKERTRSCTPPQHGGADCGGLNMESQKCNMNACPVDGTWELWGLWGDCTVTCGGGTRVRTRDCNEPQHGGADCEGEETETTTCSTHVCPIPGEFSPWSAWGRCSVTCGGGQKERSRVCNETTYGEFGVYTAPCEGDETESTGCNDFDCLPVPKSCGELVDRGLEAHSYVNLVPNRFSIEVMCNVITREAIAAINTSIININGYEGAGEYELALVYVDSHGMPISKDALSDLADYSQTCRQDVWYHCKGATINRPVTGDEAVGGSTESIINTSVKDRHGNTVLAFGTDVGEECTDVTTPAYKDQVKHYTGSAGKVLCPCGIDDSCQGENLVCNCDLNDEDLETADGGTISDRCQLPLTGLAAGDTDASAQDKVRKMEIGDFKCQGEGQPIVRKK